MPLLNSLMVFFFFWSAVPVSNSIPAGTGTEQVADLEDEVDQEEGEGEVVVPGGWMDI